MRMRNRWTWYSGMLPVFAAGAMLLGTTAAYAQDNDTDWDEYEYEADEGLHKQEWYDPSDWFDAEDGIDYEADWYDYDDYYDPYNYDPYYYDPYYNNYYYGFYPYDYDYQSDQGWYYDPVTDDWEYGAHYDYGYDPLVYDDYVYDYDYDHDLYDNNRNRQDRRTSHSTSMRDSRYSDTRDHRSSDMRENRSYRDRSSQSRAHRTDRRMRGGRDMEWVRVAYDFDNDGRFDRHDYIFAPDLNRTRHRSQSNMQRDRQGRMNHARSQRQMQASGEVTAIKSARIRGERQPHTVVKLQNDQGRRCTVDLGPKDEIRGLDIREGDRIRVRGTKFKVGDGSVLKANKVRFEGQKHRIERPEHAPDIRLQGEILQTRTIRKNQHSRAHLCAKVKTPNQRVVLVDLGPKQQLNNKNLDISEGDRLTIQGKKATYRGKPVVVAERVQNQDGQSIRIDRRNQAEDRHYEGEILSVKTMEFSDRNDDHLVINMRTDDGRKTKVILGPKDELNNVDIQSGDRIALRASHGSIDGESALVAKNLRINNRSLSIHQENGSRQFRSTMGS